MRAYTELQPSSIEARETIAELLGFVAARAETPERTRRPRASRQPSADNVAAAATREDTNEFRPGATREQTPTVDWLPTHVEEHSQPNQGPAARLLTPLAHVAPDGMFTRPPLEPLFAASWTRAIVSTIAATPAPHGPPDILRMVDMLARGTPIRSVPRRTVPTLRFGLQLLIDMSEAMTPYARDAAVLAERIGMIVGTAAVKRLYFRRCPSYRVGRSPADTWHMYAPPAQPTPVLVVTDLGIQQPPLGLDWASTQEWLRFVDMVQDARCPLIALVPYPRSRWPRELQARCAIVPWDRTTTLAVARRAVRRRAPSGTR